MRFCPTDGMWVCNACTMHFGLADPTPRCPRCYGAMVLEVSNDLQAGTARTEVEAK